MTTKLSCPYCNAEMPRSDVPASGRMVCPRCGESFAADPSRPGDPESAGGSGAQAPQFTRSRDLKHRNRLLIAGIGLAMLAVAIGAALFMLDTRSKRGLRKLSEHESLGFLPDDTDVIVGINVPIAEQTREGRDTLDRLGTGEGGALNLERLAGLKLNQIDQATIGLHVADKVLPTIRLVVQTRSAYDPEELRRKLGAARSKDDGGRTVDILPALGLLGEGALWCASARTFIVCFPANDMAKVPTEPRANAEHLSAPLFALLRERADNDSFFWLVAHSDDWRKTSLNLLLTSMRVPEDDRNTLFQMRTFAAGWRIDKGVTSSRNRPARITEEVKPGDKGIALDLVVVADRGTDMPAVREALEGWIERQKFDVRGSELAENHYSATFVGTPDEWERALQSLRDRLRKVK
jgi:hypothetical protein